LDFIFCHTRNIRGRQVIARPITICTAESNKSSCGWTLFRDFDTLSAEV